VDLLSKLLALRGKIAALAAGLGAPGILLVSFLDSSVLTFPIINDFLVVEFSIRYPARMPLYALSAALGSVVGCVVLYFLARKGGEAFFHRKAGKHAGVIRHWMEQNGFFGTLIAALLPPPTPFKIFVLAAGVFEVPVLSFTLAVLCARVFRYFGIGYLAIRYGPETLPYLEKHKSQVLLGAAVLVAMSYLVSRLILSRRHPHHPSDSPPEPPGPSAI
jgi:membrane protein YqaA with SNARE-associated domain